MVIDLPETKPTIAGKQRRQVEHIPEFQTLNQSLNYLINRIE